MTHIAEQKTFILATLRALSRAPLRDEAAAWDAIKSVVNQAADPEAACLEQPQRLARYVYDLALIYSYQTGAMPGFSNSENETLFERFVHAIPTPAGLRMSQHTVKYAIRRLDAKHNELFLRDLKAMGSSSAAE